jgi:hypothetical protein
MSYGWLRDKDEGALSPHSFFLKPYGLPLDFYSLLLKLIDMHKETLINVVAMIKAKINNYEAEINLVNEYSEFYNDAEIIHLKGCKKALVRLAGELQLAIDSDSLL